MAWRAMASRWMARSCTFVETRMYAAIVMAGAGGDGPKSSSISRLENHAKILRRAGVVRRDPFGTGALSGERENRSRERIRRSALRYAIRVDHTTDMTVNHFE